MYSTFFAKSLIFPIPGNLQTSPKYRQFKSLQNTNDQVINLGGKYIHTFMKQPLEILPPDWPI